MSFSILQKRDKSYVTKVCVTKSVTKVIVPKNPQFLKRESKLGPFPQKIFLKMTF